MSINLAIELDFTRPITAPETPYWQCGRCQYVAIPSSISPCCPGCGGPPGDGIWPETELIELWQDEVFCWNHEKAELATVVAAMYFEASVFMLIFWGTCWLDPELNWIGARFQEIRDKHQRIQRFLRTISSRKRTDAVLQRLFGADGRQMLHSVLGADGDPFLKHYLRCRAWRNAIAHRGKRIYYETLPELMRPRHASARDQSLRASLQFIPQCWVVFSRLWNEYIHKPMWAKAQLRNA